jgi:hypothetical protein
VISKHKDVVKKFMSISAKNWIKFKICTNYSYNSVMNTVGLSTSTNGQTSNNIEVCDEIARKTSDNTIDMHNLHNSEAQLGKKKRNL